MTLPPRERFSLLGSLSGGSNTPHFTVRADPEPPRRLGLALRWPGVICALLLMFVASFGAFDSNAWVEGSRYQLTLILVGFVLGTISCFAVVYALLPREDHHAFNQPVEGVAAFYFSAYVWASGGLGDIIPVSSAARMITVCELYLTFRTSRSRYSPALGVRCRCLLGCLGGPGPAVVAV